MHRASAEPMVVQISRTILMACALCMPLVWFFVARKHRIRLPPSPFQLPLLGCLPFLNSKLPHETFAKWAGKLGKIYSCRLGRQQIVVLNGGDLIREAFAKPVFSGRALMYTAQETSNGMGISFASDDAWPIHRRFALNTFIALGTVKGKVEDVVQDEAQKLVKSVADLNGTPFSNKFLLQTAVGNIICSVLFGHRYGDAEQTVTNFSAEFYDRLEEVKSFFSALGLINLFPVLRHIPSIQQSYEKVKEALEGAARVIEKVIVSHEENGDSSDIRDYVDAFMQKKKEEKAVYGCSRLFTDKQFVGATRELLMTGYDTSTTTLRWAFLYMAKHLEVQALVQAELDTVVGCGRLPVYSDLKNLPYTQATLYETQRLSTITPLGLPHRAVEDSVLCGYLIPKDTWIFANMWHVHHDSSNWEEPDNFRPERFLGRSGKIVIVPNDYMPFSAGKRSCPGESLARMELFILFTAVLQHFHLTLEGPASTVPVNGITLDTEDYLLNARARSNM